MHAEEINRLPFVSIRGRRYVDVEALLAYLASLAPPPAPPAVVKAADVTPAALDEKAWKKAENL